MRRTVFEGDTTTSSLVAPRVEKEEALESFSRVGHWRFMFESLVLEGFRIRSTGTFVSASGVVVADFLPLHSGANM